VQEDRDGAAVGAVFQRHLAAEVAQRVAGDGQAHADADVCLVLMNGSNTWSRTSGSMPAALILDVDLHELALLGFLDELRADRDGALGRAGLSS
jgi:hypothetical protein